MRLLPRLLVAGALSGLPQTAHAGGIRLTDITLNGRDVSGEQYVLLAVGDSASLCFNVEGYVYGSGEDAYAVFDLVAAKRPSSFSPVFFALSLKQLQTPETGGFRIRYCVAVPAPATRGRYTIRYSMALMFPYNVPGFDSLNLARFAKKHMDRYGSGYKALALNLELVPPNQVSRSAPFATYLRLNGKVPATEAHVEAGLNKPPVIFSWHIKPSGSGVQHRYRLFPIEEEWSQWGPASEARYYYIAPGAHQFQVVSRVPSPSGGWVEGRQAQYQFFLSKPLISKPLPKGPGDGAPTSRPPDPSSIYVKSRALLVGVTAFNDKAFGVLPYTATDVDSLGALLRRQGFDVTTKRGGLTRAQVAGAIDQFVRASERRERLVIYLSTHGFADHLDPTKGYVVSTDCHPSTPTTCLSLQDIDGMLQPVLASTRKPVQHLLLLLDACSAGLGVIGKAGGFSEATVAARQGSHVMTAGLADQEAVQDPSLKPPMSTFTYYLTKGLKGDADYTSDGYVSLSELLVYVRFNVAVQSNALQTPMMGRIGGAGEMIFAVQPEQQR